MYSKENHKLNILLNTIHIYALTEIDRLLKEVMRKICYACAKENITLNTEISGNDINSQRHNIISL
jgi:hypothetical protein